MQQFRPPPEDICARLDAWRRTGYPAEQAPRLDDDPGWIALTARPDADEDRLQRAGRRLRKLGASKSVARSWSLLLDRLVAPIS